MRPRSNTSIMEEAKFRALSINTLTGSQLALPQPLMREFCFLQLRMICELIALGCLVAHGDIEETKAPALQKSYNAGDIVKRLEKLHPNFYPVPRKPMFSPDHVHMEDYDGDFLTKDQLLTLYGRCGYVLHRGSLRNLLNPKNQPPADFQHIEHWGQKILNLLSLHTISRIGGNFHLVTALEAPQAGGNVLVSVAESPRGVTGSIMSADRRSGRPLPCPATPSLRSKTEHDGPAGGGPTSSPRRLTRRGPVKQVIKSKRRSPSRPSRPSRIVTFRLSLVRTRQN